MCLKPENELSVISNTQLATLYGGHKDAMEMTELHREMDRRIVRSVLGTAKPTMPAHGPLDPNRRLRVGYLSPDLRVYSVVFFFEPILITTARKKAICTSIARLPAAMKPRSD